MKLLNLLMALLILIALTACMGPALVDKYIDIQPNETAFVVPMEGANKTDQGKFMSLEYLNQAKVAAKRIYIPQKEVSTGRGPGSYKWIPKVQVIRVDRAPITREWTKSDTSGTDKSNQALSVESLDSINFSVGVTITALVTEEDTAQFLYTYAGKPLSHIVDLNVRGYVLGLLADEFGSRILNKCKTDKKVIFENVRSKTKNFFKQYGITVTSLGHSEGFMYHDKEIQDQINMAYATEMEIKRAADQLKAQKIRNQKDLGVARTKRRMAEEFARQSSAQAKMITLEIEKIKAEAFKEMVKRWNGEYPANVVPSGSLPLLDLGKMIK